MSYMPGSSAITVAATLSSRASSKATSVAQTSSSSNSSNSSNKASSPAKVSVSQSVVSANSTSQVVNNSKSAAQTLLELDPLDSPDFDPVAFLNREFPTEESLGGLDTFVIAISSQISALDEEISRALQQQSSAGDLASKEISDAQASIRGLFEKINDIKSKSSQSERMVQDICSDIKKLDYAKKHLQLSITTLRRLQMLENAVDQLEEMTEERAYRESAALIDAISQLFTHFETFTAIDTVTHVRARVERIRQQWENLIMVIFRDIGEVIDLGEGQPSVRSPNGSVLVSDVCLVIDALGPEFRTKLLEQFLTTQMQPYNTLFGPENKQHGGLDQVDRRWAWLKRLLKAVETRFGNIFPSHWKVPLRLCVKFYEETKLHVGTVLAIIETNRTDTTDVHILLKALQSVLRFEVEMCVRFNVPHGNNPTSNSGSVSNNSLTTSSNNTSSDLDAIDILAHAILPNGISSIFDRYLGAYVLLERHNLEELLDRLRREEDVTNGSTSHGNVYGSSMSMFAFIKSSIKRCTLLTTGQTFLSLCKEFKTCMTNYADLLKVSNTSAHARVTSTAFSYEVNLCYLVNTAEYCVEVVPQLEQMVKQKISANLVEKVDFSAETDLFADLNAFAMKCLVTSAMDRMDSAFKGMQSISWGTVMQVGEESGYCHFWHAALVDVFPKIRDSLSQLYFNNFCMKLATEMMLRFQDIITKQKKITEMGAQQLLLDAHSFKAVLLHLHHIGLDSAPSTSLAPSMYIKFINTRMTQIEVILKLVSTPEAHLVERFRVLWPDGQTSDLQMLMSIKGTKRQDQQTVLESLGIGLGTTMTNMSSTAAALSSTARSAVDSLNNLKWVGK